MAYPTTNNIPRNTGKTLNAILWAMQILVALAILAAAGAKLAGSPKMVEEFQKIGLGQWFRHVTAVLEVAVALALVFPRTAFYGAALLALVMSGAVVAHLAVLGVATAMPAVVLLILAGTIACFRRAR